MNLTMVFFFKDTCPDTWESWFELYEMAYVGYENSREEFFELWEAYISPRLTEKCELKFGQCSTELNK